MSPQSRLIGAAVILVALLAGAAAAWRGRHAAAPAPLAAGTWVRPSRAVPEFSLIDQAGKSFGTAQLHGSWSLMFFGYTNCPDFCPTTLSTLAALEKQLRSSGAAVRPRVIFVSADARRDTPEQLAKYVPYFDPEFIGLTAADQPTIDALAAKLGVAVIMTNKPDGTYTVDHSGVILVVNPRGELAAVLTGPFTVDALRADFQRIAGAA